MPYTREELHGLKLSVRTETVVAAMARSAIKQGQRLGLFADERAHTVLENPHNPHSYGTVFRHYDRTLRREQVEGDRRHVDGRYGIEHVATFISRRVVAAPFGRSLWLPARPFERNIGVQLIYFSGVQSVEHWPHDRRYSISTAGNTAVDGCRTNFCAESIAEAGLVAHTLNQAYGLDIGIKAAEALSNAWTDFRGPLPHTSAGEPYWAGVLNK